jgi:hypothetical protein
MILVNFDFSKNIQFSNFFILPNEPEPKSQKYFLKTIELKIN